jgi:hypothetical protein
MWPLAALVLAAIPPAQGNEAKLLADASDGSLEQVTLLDAALIASGVPDTQLEQQRDLLWAQLEPAIAAARLRKTPREQGQALLQQLHATLFRRYVADATDVHQVVATGDFNCLSSAIIYVVAAQGLFKTTAGMMTPRHAFVRVWANDTALDVETTTPGGFGVDRTKLMTDELLARVAAPGEDKKLVAKELRDAEQVPHITLIAGIYANRSSGLVRTGHRDAAALALDRAARLASGPARERFATWRAGLLNQSAASLAAQGQRAEARQLLELALQGADEATAKLLTGNLSALEFSDAQEAANQGDWARALEQSRRAQALGFKHALLSEFIATAQGRATTDASCNDAPHRAACWAAKAMAAVERKEAPAALLAARRGLAEANTVATRSALFFALQAQLEGKRATHECAVIEHLVAEMKPLAEDAGHPAWRSEPHVVACWADTGKAAAETERWFDAAQAFERALRADSANVSLKKNLAVMELNQSIVMSKAGRCDEARAMVRQATLRSNDVADDGNQVLEACWTAKVKEANARHDWAQAVVSAKRLVVDVPTSSLGRKNLEAMLSNLTQAQAAARQCAEAKASAAELVALGAKAPPLASCR